MVIVPLIGNAAHIQTVGQLFADVLIWFVDDTPEHVSILPAV